MRSAAAIAAAGLLLATVTAAAQPEAPRSPIDKSIVGILEVRADGLDEAAIAAFEKYIEDGLAFRKSDYWVAPKQRMREMLADSAWSEGCVFGPCLAEVRRQTNADLVVVAYFQSYGSAYGFVISLLDTKTGTVRNQAAEHCEVCTVQEALSSAALATVGLIHGISDAAPTEVKRAPPPPASRGSRNLRRASLAMLGVSALAAGATAYLATRDDDRWAYTAGGVAGAIAASGAVMLAVSFSFD